MRTKPFKKVAAFYILCLSSFLHWYIVHYFVQRELLHVCNRGKSKKLLILENCFLPQQFLCVIADTVANSNCTIFSCKKFFVYLLATCLQLCIWYWSLIPECLFPHKNWGALKTWKREPWMCSCEGVCGNRLAVLPVWLLECTCHFGKIKCSVDHNFSAQW